ncbi:hypothetical protein HanIR_Chr11g0547671 [Helianthus annuus]|nr:hypothetical protein HanIR_Chr11g0547671 [Helianthus annuus]
MWQTFLSIISFFSLLFKIVETFHLSHPKNLQPTLTKTCNPPSSQRDPTYTFGRRCTTNNGSSNGRR